MMAKKAKARRKAMKGRSPAGAYGSANVTLPPIMWDRGADGPANQHRLVEEPATDIDPETGKETPNPNNVRRVRRQSWLVTYALAGHIDKGQFAAGEKLRMAADGMREKDPLAAIGADIMRHQSDPIAAIVDARQFFRQLWSVIPPSSRPVVERVVIEDRPLQKCNSEQRERYMQRLRDGLQAIA